MNAKKITPYAFYLDRRGGAEAFDPRTLPRAESCAWLHLSGHDPKTRAFLKDDLSLDPLLVRALLADETRPRAEESGGGLLLILRGVNPDAGEDPEDMVSLRLWVEQDRIVSVSRRRVPAIDDMAARLRAGKGAKTPAEFMTQVLSVMLDGVEPILSALHDTADAVEEAMIGKPTAALRDRISDLRREAIVFRRHLVPQRDAIVSLRSLQFGWLGAQDRRHLKESHDRITRHVEDLDALRERGQVVQDELGTLQSEKLSRNLYVLSVITLTFMPLTFVTGLFGMNVQGIPLGEHPHGFMLLAVFLALVAGAQLLLLKLLKWF